MTSITGYVKSPHRLVGLVGGDVLEGARGVDEGVVAHRLAGAHELATQQLEHQRQEALPLEERVVLRLLGQPEQHLYHHNCGFRV